MDGKDRYRVAPGGKITVPWPFKISEASDEAEETFKSIEKQCMTILHASGINLFDCMVVGMEGPGRSKKDTLIIDVRSERSTHWQQAASQILDLLNGVISSARSELKFRVELRDSLRMYQDRCFSPNHMGTSNQEACRAFEVVEPVVTLSAGQNCSGLWNSISVSHATLTFGTSRKSGF